jgi:hypothetical protein
MSLGLSAAWRSIQTNWASASAVGYDFRQHVYGFILVDLYAEVFNNVVIGT